MIFFPYIVKSDQSIKLIVNRITGVNIITSYYSLESKVNKDTIKADMDKYHILLDLPKIMTHIPSFLGDWDKKIIEIVSNGDVGLMIGSTVFRINIKGTSVPKLLDMMKKFLLMGSIISIYQKHNERILSRSWRLYDDRSLGKYRIGTYDMSLENQIFNASCDSLWDNSI